MESSSPRPLCSIPDRLLLLPSSAIIIIGSIGLRARGTERCSHGHLPPLLLLLLFFLISFPRLLFLYSLASFATDNDDDDDTVDLFIWEEIRAERPHSVYDHHRHHHHDHLCEVTIFSLRAVVIQSNDGRAAQQRARELRARSLSTFSSLSLFFQYIHNNNDE